MDDTEEELDMEEGGAEATAAREGAKDELMGTDAAATMGAPQTSHSVAEGSFLKVQEEHVLAGRPGGGGGFLVEIDAVEEEDDEVDEPAFPAPPRRRSSLAEPRKASEAS